MRERERRAGSISMATLSFGIATTSVSAAAGYRRRSNSRWRTPTILSVGWVTNQTKLLLLCLMSYGLVSQLVFDNLLREGRTPKACLADPKPATSPGSSFEDASRETRKHAKPSNVKFRKTKNAVKPFDKYFSFVFLFLLSISCIIHSFVLLFSFLSPVLCPILPKSSLNTSLTLKLRRLSLRLQE